MRTDVMIGAVVAGILAIVFVGWIVFGQGSNPTETPSAPESADTEQVNVLEGVEPLTGEAELPTESAMEAEPAFPPPPADFVEPGYAETTPPPIEPAAETVDDTGPPVADWRVEAPAETPLPPALTPLPGETLVAAERSYVVQRGDTYGGIAQREYGKASLSKLIMDANPNVPARSLRPGMTIRIPPQPVAPTPVAGQLKPIEGAMGVDPVTGKRFYIVRKDDTQGFWGIAKAIYGGGRYYLSLQEANPGVNPNKLRPGQKIWAPELTTEAASGTGAVAAGTTPSTQAPPARIRVETGAPVRTVLPDGRVFD